MTNPEIPCKKCPAGRMELAVLKNGSVSAVIMLCDDCGATHSMRFLKEDGPVPEYTDPVECNKRGCGGYLEISNVVNESNGVSILHCNRCWTIITTRFFQKTQPPRGALKEWDRHE